MRRSPQRWSLALALVGALSACASSGTPQSAGPTLDGDPAGPDTERTQELSDDELLDDPYLEGELAIVEGDPLEGVNRAVFGFNEGVERFVFAPVGRVYGWILPGFARRAILRFFANLNQPAIFVNSLLQLRMRDAGSTLARLTVNSTVGLAGLFDPATRVGLDERHADFGQTLANVGVGSGPYLVVPVFGPSTVRDAFGDLVDRLMRPTLYILGPAPELMLGGGAGIANYEANREQLAQLRETSLDFYVAMRNVYFQNRAAQLGEGPVPEAETDPAEEEMAEAPEGAGGAEMDDPRVAPGLDLEGDTVPAAMAPY